MMKNYTAVRGLITAALLTFGPGAFAQEYVLETASVVFNDGSIFDSRDPNVSVSGTMTVSGDAVTQTITLTVGGSSSTASPTATLLSANDYSVTVNENGVERKIILLEVGNRITTFAVSSDGSEVDRWVLANAFSAAYAPKRGNTGGSAAPAAVNADVGAGILALNGLRQR